MDLHNIQWLGTALAALFTGLFGLLGMMFRKMFKQQGDVLKALVSALQNHLAHDEENLTKIADRMDRGNEVLVKIVTILEERRPTRARRK